LRVLLFLFFLCFTFSTELLNPSFRYPFSKGLCQATSHPWARFLRVPPSHLSSKPFVLDFTDDPHPSYLSPRCFVARYFFLLSFSLPIPPHSFCSLTLIYSPRRVAVSFLVLSTKDIGVSLGLTHILSFPPPISFFWTPPFTLLLEIPRATSSGFFPSLSRPSLAVRFHHSLLSARHCAPRFFFQCGPDIFLALRGMLFFLTAPLSLLPDSCNVLCSLNDFGSGRSGPPGNRVHFTSALTVQENPVFIANGYPPLNRLIFFIFFVAPTPTPDPFLILSFCHSFFPPRLIAFI